MSGVPSSAPVPAETAPVSRADRPTIVGPEEPKSPYPLFLRGAVQKGFGRGSKELGIPTGAIAFLQLEYSVGSERAGADCVSCPARSSFSFATSARSVALRRLPSLSLPANLPDASILPLTSLSLRGVYYGYAKVLPKPAHNASQIGTATPSTQLEQDDIQVHPMVMSVGWNPYYKNERLTAVSSLLLLLLSSSDYF